VNINGRSVPIYPFYPSYQQYILSPLSPLSPLSLYPLPILKISILHFTTYDYNQKAKIKHTFFRRENEDNGDNGDNDLGNNTLPYTSIDYNFYTCLNGITIDITERFIYGEHNSIY